MNVWMDGLVNGGCVDWWIGEGVDGGLVDVWIVGWVNGWMGRWMGGWTNHYHQSCPEDTYINETLTTNMHTLFLASSAVIPKPFGRCGSSIMTFPFCLNVASAYLAWIMSSSSFVFLKLY